MVVAVLRAVVYSVLLLFGAVETVRTAVFALQADVSLVTLWRMVDSVQLANPLVQNDRWCSVLSWMHSRLQKLEQRRRR